MRTLVLGGARSGKSAWAEQQLLSAASGELVHYVATARPWPGDTDFEARVAGHVQRRKAQEHTTGVRWQTLEHVDAVVALRNWADLGAHPRVLVDDIGTWLTHLFDREQLWEAPRGSGAPYVAELVAAVQAWPDSAQLYLVSPEVGLGVIPEHASGRLFRDEIGLLNQQLAAVCERVVLVIAGCPLVVKDVT